MPAAKKTSTRKKPAKKVEQTELPSTDDGNGGRGSTSPAPAPIVVDDADPKTIEAPPSTEIAARYPEDVYRAMSAADEQQIAQELQGRAVKAMVYSFPQGGKTVTGLSWKGVREAVRQVNTRGFGRIHIDPSVKPEFEDVEVDAEIGTDSDGATKTEKRRAIRCTVYARDGQHGGGNFGTATQLCEMELRKKDKKGRPVRKPDPFAATKALSKAERNAQEPFIPLELVEELKQLYIGKGAVEYIPGSAREVDASELPPPLTDEKAKKQTEQIRGLYQQVKQKHGLSALPPAAFNRYLIAAQHSHDRLNDFIEHLQSLIAEEKTK